MPEFVMHPALALFLGAALLPWLRGSLRSVAVVALPLVALALVWQLPDGPAWQARFLEHTITPLQADKLSRLFAAAFAIVAAAGGLFALGQPSRLELPAAFVYAGSAIGVVLAGDLITMFVFWELMAIGSTLVLWSHGTAASYQAARRYLMIHLLGGVVLLAGVTAHVTHTGSIAFTSLATGAGPHTLAHWLILIGFLVNAAAPPLSAWLPDAYPEASWSGMVFLSAFTTKTAVYVLIRGFAGTELLIWVGLFMVFYGIVYALLENDMRRILAYAIVNQVGFKLVGVGIGTEMAVNGAAAHAFAGVIYMALLLMCAGSVLMMSHRRHVADLGGLFRTMPLTAVCALIGALAISAFPLTSGFVSKSMVSQSAMDAHLLSVWLLLTAASAGVVLHAGLRFPWLVFFQKDSGLQPRDPPTSMRWAMVLLAVLCIAVGLWVKPLYDLLPHPVKYEPYTAAHVLTQIQLLLFSALAFFMLLPHLRRAPTITLDTDWVWRKLLPGVWQHARSAWESLARQLGQQGFKASAAIWHAMDHFAGADTRLARTWSTRAMAFVVLVLLLGYLVLYYV